MLNSVDLGGRPFHFIGIGGIGMSALAYVLAKRSLPVSGSDLSLSDITRRLQEQGAHIFLNQDASNLEFFKPVSLSAGRASSSPAAAVVVEPTPDTRTSTATVADPSLLPQVICSTAINTSNSEYRAALELGCPIFHRSDLLAALMCEYRGIAIAGTHGKTTTSSMTGYLLLKAGLDPTIVVGGEVTAWEGNAHVGEGPYLVAEADESDGSLVKLAAQIGVVTNVELDHPDHYASLEEVVQIFQTFSQNCKTLIACIDSEAVQQNLTPDLTYSLNPERGADYTVDQVVYSPNGCTARVWERGQMLGQMSLKLLGQHNLSNALAVVAIGRLLGLEFEQIATILANFEGARRRFERRGEYNQILFIDDYAHHPSEIQATLAAARLKAQQRRVVAVFQPHRFSRTQTFLHEFAQSFSDADLVVTTEIYSAGETNTGEVSGQRLATLVAEHHPNAVFQPTLAEVSSFLKETLAPGDLVLFLGAGNLNRTIPELMTHFAELDQDTAA
jgi:UDP-N-acetylmuramate--alanine ligase